ncbi:MAG: AMP-binding protein, partial [Pyrinomonadaceae bacterium]
MSRSAFDNSIVWSPDERVINHARLTEFMSQFMSKGGIDSFDALYRRSIEDISWFTEEVIKFLGVSFDPPYSKILDTSQGVEWAKWCIDGGLNISEVCVDKHLVGDSLKVEHEKVAIIWEGEEGEIREFSYAQLHTEVEYCAAGLRSFGIGMGDTIGIHLPMIPETIIAILATARIGAISVPIFSGYGAQAIKTRLQDAGAKIVFTCDAFPRRGTPVHAWAAIDEALKDCPSVERVIVVSRLGIELQILESRDIRWNDLQTEGKRLATEDREKANSATTAAEDPLILLYTSGTTGRPKGILHSHCGFPIKAAQDMALCIDVHANERVCWITDTGWMMGPWLIYGALILGATITIYDGAPDFPKADRLWSFCAGTRVNVLGISPTLVRALSVYGGELPSKHDLSSLRILASTGEP